MKKISLFSALIVCILGLNAQNPTIMNGDFELWSHGEPVNWTINVHGDIVGASMNYPVEVNFATQSTDVHSGSSAIRLTSATATSTAISFTFNLPGILQVGESEGFSITMSDAMALMQLATDTSGLGILDAIDSVDFSALETLLKVLSKGIPCSSTPTAVTAWTKYIPQEGDQMMFLAVTKKEGVIVDYAYKLFGNSNPDNYNQIGISFNTPYAECDTLLVMLFSSTQTQSSSVLFVDDVQLDYTNGVSSLNKFPGRVYPNPATDKLYICPENDHPYVWTLTDMTGKALLTGEATGETSIDTRNCAPGFYLLHLNNEEQSSTRKIMIH